MSLFVWYIATGKFITSQPLAPREGGYSYILAIYMCRLIGYDFRGAQSRVSFLALWSFDRVPKSQALLKT